MVAVIVHCVDAPSIYSSLLISFVYADYDIKF